MKKSHLLVVAGIMVSISLLVQTSPKASLAYDIPAITTVVRTNSSHTVGYYGLGQVSCNSNETLTGGGYFSAQWHELLSVYRNGPSDDGKKWLVEMMYTAPNYYGTAPSFTVYAVCAKIAQ